MHRLIVPHHSPNDGRAVIVSWLTEDGAAVSTNQVVVSLESAKAVFDIEGPEKGFLRQLARAGDEVTSGDVIGAITATIDERLPDDVLEAPVADPEKQKTGESKDPGKAEGRRAVTARAMIVARRLGIDVTAIPGTGRLSASEVEQFAATKSEKSRHAAFAARAASPSPSYATKISGVKTTRLLLIGGGNGANVTLDVVSRDHASGLIPVGILDDDPTKHGSSIMGVPVLGDIDSALERWKSGEFDAAIITISTNNRVRSRIFEQLVSQGVRFANIVDPDALVSPSAVIGTGNLILSYCRVGFNASIGNNNFFSAMVNIEHDNVIGSHTSFGPGVVFSGRVRVGDGVVFGTMIGCEPGIEIGEWSVIASGAVVTSDVPARSVLKTSSIGRIRPIDS
jgi:sugar O-acyltransferase (sialic acid O-acetyltransferase NeuD family)